jgi:hypothetical protein
VAGNWQPVAIISAATMIPAHLVRIETPLIFIDVSDKIIQAKTLFKNAGKKFLLWVYDIKIINAAM